MKRILGWIGYGLYLMAFLLLVDYLFFYRGFVAELRERTPKPDMLKPPRHLGVDDMRLLGSLRTDRRSSFVHFEQAKPNGVVRLCAFGDSFTHGDEVEDGHDYPALLSEMFQARGVGNVQVVNFGSAWHGFHQTYILWDRLGRRFDCDVLLLGPASFQAQRDTTFHHSLFNAPYYLHARYVLDRGDVRLVPVSGSTAEARFDAYYAFVPRWDYLRHDRNPPAFLQAVLSTARTLPNPFYYRDDDPEDESLATYAPLVRAMGEDGTPIVWLARAPRVANAASALSLPALAVAPAPTRATFPYYAPGGHNTAWGNARVAAQYFNLLVAGEPAAVPAFHLRRRVGVSQPDDHKSTDALTLDRLEAIHARLGTQALGVLARATPPGSRYAPGRPDGFRPIGDEPPLGPDSTLLAIRTEEVAPVDAAHLVLPFAVAAGDSVTVRAEAARDAGAMPLPPVERPDPRLPFAAITLPRARFQLRGSLVIRGQAARDLAQVGERITLQVAGRTILEGETGGRSITLVPSGGGALLRFVPIESAYQPAANFPREAPLQLLFTPESGPRRALPFGSYALEAAPFPRPIRALSRRLVLHDGEAHLQPRRQPGAPAPGPHAGVGQ